MLPAEASNTAVGAVPGSFDVSATGAATYSIPIVTPGGIHGMHPSLALVYNSQSGDGMAGWGWSLAGLSAITRCSHTIDSDGATQGVALVQGDDYCLDGARLRAKSGTSGADGTIYDTEIEQFYRITSYSGSSATDGPDHFVVETTDGRVLEYGNTTDSRVFALGTTVVRVWALDKISDLNGNYIKFHYIQDTADGDYWPDYVTYTGNANTGTSAPHKIQFDYVSRPDTAVVTGYVAGSLTSATQLLSDIQVIYSGSATLTYTLNYQTAPATGRQRLTSVTECAADGSCFAPTAVTWEDGAAGWQADVATGHTVPNANQAVSAHLMDIDGDGKSDLLYPNNPNWAVLFGDASTGFTGSVSTRIPFDMTYAPYAMATDYNGDGKGDLLVADADGTWDVLQSTGSRADGGIFSSPTVNTSTATHSTGYWDGNATTADYDGDGLDDLVYSDGTNVYERHNNGGSFGAETTVSGLTTSTRFFDPSTSLTTTQSFSDMAMDFDGSGRVGRLGLTEQSTTTTCTPDDGPYCKPTTTVSYRWHPLVSEPDGSFQSIGALFTSSIDLPPVPADFNGDGLTDLLWTSFGSGTGYTDWLIELSTGTGLVEVDTGVAYAENGVMPVILDYYGNGQQEALIKTGSGWKLVGIQYDPASHGFVAVVSSVSAPYGSGYVPGSLRIGDINGDGLPDIVYASNDGGTLYWHYRLHKAPEADLVTGITDGLGNSYSPDYDSLSTTASYTAGSGASYPNQDFQGAIYVVTDYVGNAGNGATYTDTYTYNGARLEVNGRGFLGFAGRTVANNRSALLQTTTYSQDFPTIGSVAKDTATDTTTGEVVESTAYTYSSLQQGNRVFPYASEITATKWNTDGTLISTTDTTVNSVDAYGHVKSQTTKVTDKAKNVDLTTMVSNTYDNETAADWCLGLATETDITNTLLDGTSTTRKTSAVPDTGYCRVKSVTLSGGTSDHPGTPLTTTYTYDDWGNVHETDVTASDIATRSTITTYNSAGEYPATVEQVVNGSLSLVSSQAWRADLGVQKTFTDPNSHKTQWQYDGFGRRIQETRPDGSYSQWVYSTCDSSCPSTGAYLVTHSEYGNDGEGVLSGYSAFDMKGRAVESSKVLLGGAVSHTDTQYDALGRLKRVSKPYTGSYANFWTRYIYDDLSRIASISQPDGDQDPCKQTSSTFTASVADNCGDMTAFDYTVLGNGLKTTATRTVANADPSMQTQVTETTANVLSQVAEIVNASGSTDAITTDYTYDPFGNLATVNNAGHTTSIFYDDLGHKYSMTDPDMGTWIYKYDALGELLTQTDAKGQVVSQTYDTLGRIKTRTQPVSGGTGTTNWNYDTAANGLGLLASVQDYNGYEKDYAYDSLSRPQNVGTLVSGTEYDVSTTYDAFGRVDTVTYPASATPSTAGTTPAASFTISDSTVTVGQSFTLDGSGSTDPNGQTLQYNWTAQNGADAVVFANPFGATTDVTVTTPGQYTLQLTVSDSLAGSAPVTKTVTVSPPVPNAPTFSPATSYDGSYTVKWTAVTGADSYEVFESDNGGGYTQIATVSGTSKSLSGQGNGTYSYKIAACAGSICSNKSAPNSIDVDLPPPTPAKPTVTPSPSWDGNYTLDWVKPTTGVVTAYQVFASSDGTNYSRTNVGDVQSRDYTGKSAGIYYYEVAACNTYNSCSAPSTARSETVYGKPYKATLSTSGVDSSGDFTLYWSVNTDSLHPFSYYVLQGSLTSDFSSPNTIYTGTNTSRNFTNVLAGSTHYYRVHACNSQDICGSWSDTLSVTVPVSSGGGSCTGTTCTQPKAVTYSPSPGSTTSVPSTGSTNAPAPAPATAAPPPAQSTPSLPAPAASTASGAIGAVSALPDIAGGAPLTATAAGPVVPASSAFVATLSPRARLDALRQRYFRVAPLATNTPQPVARVTPTSASLLTAVEPAHAAAHPAPWLRYLTSGGSGGTPYRLSVRYVYDPISGALTAVEDANSGYRYWTAATDSGLAPVDAFGHLLAYTDGNDESTVTAFDQATGAVLGISTGIGQASDVQQLIYKWDGYGNLVMRKDVNRNNLKEAFTYDALNRLSTSAVTNSTANSTLGVSYTPDGNIESLANSARPNLGGTYTYDPSHPHAVQSMSNVAGTYSYDGNGNMISGGGKTYTWDALNRPTEIDAAGVTETFAYGPSGERYLETDATSARTTSKISIGGLFEAVTTPSGIEYRHTIMAGSAVAVISIDASGNLSANYLHSDHLGSVDAITDASGHVAETMSFDAFGNRRAPDTWSALTAAPSLTGTTDRGYTYQEQLDDLNLVHMNGRVYSPEMGTFVSTDPLVGGNRFAYVKNNPLSNTDPSGYLSLSDALCFMCDATSAGANAAQNAGQTAVHSLVNLGWGATDVFMNELQSYAPHEADLVRHHWKEGVALGVAVYTGGAAAAAWGGGFWATAGVGAVSGATFGGTDVLLNGGTVNEALVASAHGAAVGAVGGGLLYGANALTSYAGNNFIVGVASHAAAGGLTSVAAGGNFQKGAEFGALAYMAYWGYQKMVNGESPSWRSGKGVVYKQDGDAAAESQVNNNFGPANVTNNPNLVGSPVLDPCGGCEGTTFSNAMNSVYGMNAVATLHDVWGDLYQVANGGSYPLWFNIATQVPAATITYSALINTSIGYGLGAGIVTTRDNGGP